MGFLSKLFDPGKGDRDKAGARADEAQIKNFGGDSAFGGGQFNSANNTTSFGLGEMGGNFANLQQMLAGIPGNAGAGLGGLFAGGQDALGGLGGTFQRNAMPFQAPGLSPMNQSLGQGLAQQFFNPQQSARASQFLDNNQGLFDTLGQSAQQLGAGQLDIARQIAAPQEQRDRVRQANNLHATGRAGTTGGLGDKQAMMEAQNMADLQRQQMAFGQGQAVRGQAMNQLGQNMQIGMGLNAQNFGQALQGSQQNEMLRQGQFGRDLNVGQFAQGINAQNFGQAFQQAGMNADMFNQQFQRDLTSGQFGANNAMNRFNIADQMFNAQRQSAMDPFQQMNMGLGGMSQMQNMSLAAFQNAMAAEQSRSNSLLQGSTVHANNAQNAKSPFLEALNAAGQFAGNISSFAGAKTPAGE